MPLLRKEWSNWFPQNNKHKRKCPEQNNKNLVPVPPNLGTTAPLADYFIIQWISTK